MSENKDNETYMSVNLHGKDEPNPESTCSCPKRETPPPVPKELPFPDTPENRGRLRDWILDRYASSAFNQCEHQPLPLMRDSPPIQLHEDPKAKPYVIHKPHPLPIELDRDVRIGVLEQVPIGDPTD